ncbi:MAG: nicotinate-nucleotide diphosphorylase (carboxylating) [Crocinitomicaceae bacterium]|nr:nicotinate-nucleotide diphosphorylase (carboxylating) [Crocinitomicaceae bacterium]
MLNDAMKSFIALTLREDIGDGDVTSESSVPSDLIVKGYILAKEEGVVAGISVALEVFNQVNPSISFNAIANDGDSVKYGDVIIELEGAARSILTGERLALNFMQRMSGIATRTNEIVSLLEGTPTKVLDTRKTTPGLRAFEKWAVYLGGGVNHRMGLYDMILLKDNHVDYAGGMKEALLQVASFQTSRVSHLPLVIETRSYEEIEIALEASSSTGIKIDRILLDNFSHAEVAEAVKRYSNKVVLEASGGITLENVRGYGDAGVAFVSMGYITHSVNSLDLSLKSTPHVS